MSISTMEQFSALEVGTTIRVGDNSNVWTKEDADRWVRDNLGLRDIHFAGDIAQSRVSTTIAPEASQVWTDGIWHYVLIAPGTEEEGHLGQWHALRCTNEGVYSRLARVRVDNYTYVPDRPAWADNLYAIGQQMHLLSTERQQFYARFNEATQALAVAQSEHRGAMTTLKSRIQNGLHAYVNDNPDARQVIGDLLAENEMQRPPTMVDVKVTVTGRSIVQGIPAEMLSTELVEGVDSVFIPQTAMYVYWTKAIEGQVRGPEGSCACANVSRAWVLEKFNEEGFSCSSVDSWDARCANHEEVEDF